MAEEENIITMRREQFEEFCRILENPPQKKVDAFMQMMNQTSILKSEQSEQADK